MQNMNPIACHDVLTSGPKTLTLSSTSTIGNFQRFKNVFYGLAIILCLRSLYCNDAYMFLACPPGLLTGT